MLLFKLLVFAIVSISSLIFSNINLDNINSFDFINFIDGLILKYGNNDIVGKLVINSLDVDTPIVQGKDNLYYLKYDEYKNENSKGAIFIDYRNNIDIDRKLLIYGHNSRESDTIFKKLESYLSFDFFSNSDNREVEINTRNKKMIYEVSSVFVVDKDFSHMDLSFSLDEWNSHIDWINNSSIYDIELNYSDEIIIMQTCYYEPDNSFLLVILKKIDEIYY